MLILTSLAMMLVATAQALTLESKAPGVDPTNKGVVEPDAFGMGEEGIVYGGTPVSNYRNGEIEGKLDPMNVAGTNAPSQDRQPDPRPRGLASDATGNQRDALP